MRVLISGMGNDLCRDDGFGIETVRRFSAGTVPPDVRVIESGIGGIALVQELMDIYDMLVVVDAVDRGGKPGTTYVLEVEVPAISDMSEAARADFSADMHYTVPSRALILARALGVLPPYVYLLGCQIEEEGLGIGLSPRVQEGVVHAVEALHRLLSERSDLQDSHYSGTSGGQSTLPAILQHSS